MTAIYREDGMRGDVKFLRGQGEVWGTFQLSVKETGETAFTSKEIDIYLGCLLTNWKLMTSNDNETVPFTCVDGNFTFHKGKTHKVSVSTKAMPFRMDAALRGLNVTDGAVADQQVLVREKKTITLSGAATTIPLDTPGYFGTALVASEIKKVVSLIQVSNGHKWSQVASGSELNANETFSFDGTNPDVVFSAALSATDDTDFVITIQYYRDMVAGDLKASEDGETYAESIDFVLSWLYKIESGPNKGEKGYRIAIARNCVLTSDVEMGTDAKGVGEQSLEFEVNFMEEGDLEIHQGVLS